MTELELQIMWNKIEGEDLAYYQSATAPEGCKVYSNISYKPDGCAEHMMDVIRPKDVPVDQKLPVIVNVHGGGFVYGYKDSYYKYYCMNLAKYGYAVVSINYRLAFCCPFPAQIEDIYALMNYLPEIADTYGLDVDRLYMVGDSAGANLTSLFNVIERDDALKKRYGLTSPIAPKALGLYCGVYDFDLLEVKRGTADVEIMLTTLFGRSDYHAQEYYEYASVLPYVNEDFPPCFLMGAKADGLCYQTEAMVETLTSKGVNHKLAMYDKKDLGHVFHLKEIHKESREVMDAMIEWFQTL